MDLVSLIHGKWPLRRRLRLLRLARATTLEQLADAQMTVEGLKADLVRIDNAIADHQERVPSWRASRRL